METREIKFRAISEETDDMRYGSLTVEYDGTCHINWWVSLCIEPENNYYEPAPFFEVVKKETIGQFTGLTDKNGKEIFEGDVIKNARGDWGVIVWKAPYFEVTVSETQSSLYSREYFDEVEIIGNIHEHPELLTPNN